MTTLTANRVAELPRVNLLPPEIGEASRLRRIQALLLLLILGVLAVVVLLFLWASGQVGSAEESVTAAEAEGAALEAQVAEFAEVPQVLAEVDAAEAALVTAMQPEIRFSFLLNDLSLTSPASSRLTSLTANNAAAAAQLDGTTTATVTQLGEPTMGTVTFASKSTSMDAVASWLQSLSSQGVYVEPSLQNAAKEGEGTTEGTVYTVSSIASLSLKAASNRYEQIAEGQ